MLGILLFLFLFCCNTCSSFQKMGLGLLDPIVLLLANYCLLFLVVKHLLVFFVQYVMDHYLSQARGLWTLSAPLHFIVLNALTQGAGIGIPSFDIILLQGNIQVLVLKHIYVDYSYPNRDKKPQKSRVYKNKRMLGT